MFNKWVGCVGIGFFFSIGVLAGIKQPEITLHREDLRYTISAEVENDFRNYLFRNAKSSIRVITFDQRADEDVGMPTLRELGLAAERGVDVEFISTWTGRALLDPLGWSSRYIQFLSEKYRRQEGKPGSFTGFVVGGPVMKKRGWFFSDNTHIKLVIIDDQFVVITGRGHANVYVKWLDTAFFFKGPGVQQCVEVFKNIWAIFQEESPSRQSIRLNEGAILSFAPTWVQSMYDWIPGYLRVTQAQSNGIPASLSEQEKFWDERVPSRKTGLTQSQAQKEELEKLISWSKLDPLPASNEAIQMQLLQNHFFEQMKQVRGKPSDYSIDQRLTFLKDEVLDTAIESIDRAQRRIRFFTFAMIMDPELEKALLAAAARGVDVQILTNSKEAHSHNIWNTTFNFTSKTAGLWLAVGHYNGLQSMLGLMSRGAKIAGLKVTPNYEFLHRKLLLIDDETYFGSHNLTKASSALQEELNIRVKDRVLADWVQAEFERATSPEFSEWMDEKKLAFELSDLTWSGTINQLKAYISGHFDFIY